MKTKYSILSVLALLLAFSCQKPEFIPATADRQGISSIEALFVTGPYTGQTLGKLVVSDDKADRFVIPIPWYYPEASDDLTLTYMTKLRLRAELQPNFSISPKLGIVDLTEENWYTYTDASGNSRKICITGERRKSSECSLVSFLIEDMMVSGIIYKDDNRVLIPFKEDLSSVTVSGQVSPHASLYKIGDKIYKEGGKYNLNSGTTITVLAPDGETKLVYKVEQGDPETLDMGLNKNSVAQLFNEDPVSILGLPEYTTLSYVSIAAAENKLMVCLGDGSAPMIVNGFNGAKEGAMSLGAAKADVITNDEAGHILIANLAQGGDNAEDVNVYMTSSPKVAPELLGTFTNPTDCPIGHRMKVLGDIAGDALITFTTEGIPDVTNASKAVVVPIKGGVLGEPFVKDFSGLGLNWGSAPVHFATVVPASLNPEQDGYFLDYYDDNADTAIADADTRADAYILHHITGKGAEERSALVGNWANNPNCLDIKTFNGARYMVLFVVSHFPNWGTSPRMYLYDVTDPSGSLSPVFENKSIPYYQKGAYDGTTGAAGDVVIAPTSDGYRMFVYYYDHHAQSIGAYVADCIKL